MLYSSSVLPHEHTSKLSVVKASFVGTYLSEYTPCKLCRVDGKLRSQSTLGMPVPVRKQAKRKPLYTRTLKSMYIPPGLLSLGGLR